METSREVAEVRPVQVAQEAPGGTRVRPSDVPREADMRRRCPAIVRDRLHEVRRGRSQVTVLRHARHWRDAGCVGEETVVYLFDENENDNCVFSAAIDSKVFIESGF